MVDSISRVLIIDDHELFAESLAGVLRRDGVTSDVVCVASGDGARQALRGGSFALVLCDLGLPDVDGLDLLREIRSQYPTTRVCVLSANVDREPMVEAVTAGACGYLAKTIDLEEFVDKVKLALDGYQVYDEASAAKIIEGFSTTAERSLLAPRELEVLALVAQGSTNERIAETLFISTNTVKDSLKGTYLKLGVNDRAAAVAEGFRLGLLR